MQFTLDQILALAPDDSSAKAAKGLVSPGKWPTLGGNDVAVWGECQGSGSKPYQTQIDLNGPAFRCSCPSRKFPCKHGLALFILRVQNTASFTLGGEPPTWVGEWLASRQDRATKQEAKLAAAVEEAAKPVDPEAAAKREAKRGGRMAAGVDELERWLADQIRNGIGSLEAAGREVWETLAARMVDAQAPGLALRVKELGEIAGAGGDWPARLLARMGQLQLLLEASRRLDTLSEEQRADVRYALGVSLAKEEVLARGEKISDHWSVLGVHVDERERLWERRVWLQGKNSRRMALLLDFAHGSPRFADSWVSGGLQEATLAFYPGAMPLRAIVDPAQPRSISADPAPVFSPLNTALEALADSIAANPWQSPQPLCLSDMTPVFSESRWWLKNAEGQALPLLILSEEAWLLLAACGGEAVQVFGEWQGEGLRPLSAWQGRQIWTTGARA